MATGQFCLKWNNFHNSIVTAFESLQSTEELVDVTLMCEGRNVKAHKVILSACSPYFRNLFKETPCKHPIIILKDVLYCDLVAILQFMYQGEVLVDQDGLASFLKTAELLQVSGLAGSTSSATGGISDDVNNVVPPSNSKQAGAPLISKPEVISPVRTKSPSSPKPALVKVRNDIAPPVEPVIEKENIITREPEDEPMQSCSYQTPENVIIKTESADDQDYHELDYLEPMDDPGSTTTEEQSILERSLKAQGKLIHGNEDKFEEHQHLVQRKQRKRCKQIVDTVASRTNLLKKRRNIVKPKRFTDNFLYYLSVGKLPTHCPKCNIYISQEKTYFYQRSIRKRSQKRKNVLHFLIFFLTQTIELITHLVNRYVAPFVRKL